MANHWQNRAAVFVLEDDFSDEEVRQIHQTCNVLVPDSVNGPVAPEYHVVGRELWLNAAQFNFVCKMIFTDNTPSWQTTAGRWVFTRTSNTLYWMMKLAARLEEDNWDGYDPALALRCYEHAAWCDTRPNCMPDADDCAEVVMRNPREEINRLKSELEFPGFFDDFLEDDFNFSGQRNVVELRIPEGTHRIPPGAFRGCRNLRSIHIPDSVVEVGENAFADCPQLISRPHYTKDGTRLIVWPNAPESVVISPYAQIIGIGAFCQSRDLREVNYNPTSLAISGHDAAYHFAILPNAFAGCPNLCRFHSYSFVDKMNPREWVCRNNAKSVLVGAGAFKNCRELEGFEPVFGVRARLQIETIDWLGLSISGLLPRGDGMFDLDEGHNIDEPDESFADCLSLRSVGPVVLSGDCDRMFAGCISLRSVELVDVGNGRASIDEEMFDGCLSLSSIRVLDAEYVAIESRPMFVSSRAFNGCTVLANDGINVSAVRRDSPADALDGSSLTIPHQHPVASNNDEREVADGDFTEQEFFDDVSEDDDEEDAEGNSYD